jgi:phosphoribosylaminoimidazolecarboxamide formyltransferase/IMP cyclohydrolase
MIKRALISVYDKSGILEMATFLTANEVEIISTGGTYKYLTDNHINVTEISEVTGFDEILNGRVKTLHPNIHGGILAIRDNVEHMNVISKKGIVPIDMVIVNLYPFFNKVNEDISFEEKIEFIDIGGPAMLRSSGKNFKDVIAVVDVKDYRMIMGKLEENNDVDFETRKQLAGKVFNLTSAYDAAISNFLISENSYPEYLTNSYAKKMDLRYGENPHQSAAYYVATSGKGAMKDFEQLNGKELSYNNIKDMDIAWKVVCEFEETACCALKHNSPCGVAIGGSAAEAYTKAYNCDPVSIFGGIVGINKRVDKRAAEELIKIFLEVIIAPDYDEDALSILCSKKNLRVIKCTTPACNSIETVTIDGGILVQSRDSKLIDELKTVTEVKPTDEEINNMIFGMKVVKYVKSNAIVVVRNEMAVGIAGGQVNRIWAASQALDRAKGGTVLVSDAFFPFGDVVEEANKYGIKAIMQPGGSIRDQESIDLCNKYGISMLFTGVRHFKH